MTNNRDLPATYSDNVLNQYGLTKREHAAIEIAKGLAANALVIDSKYIIAELSVDITDELFDELEK